MKSRDLITRLLCAGYVYVHTRYCYGKTKSCWYMCAYINVTYVRADMYFRVRLRFLQPHLTTSKQLQSVEVWAGGGGVLRQSALIALFNYLVSYLFIYLNY